MSWVDWQWEGLQIERMQGWCIASARAPAGTRSWWAWGKMGLIRGGCPLSEPGRHVWAQHAATREEAVQRLKTELGLIR